MDPDERIKSLSEQGNAVEVDKNIPLKRYFRSGMEMARMATTYDQEENLESAFILYVRFITLFIEKVRTHPNYQDYSSIEKKNITRKVNDVFPRAEHIKYRLREKYQQEHEELVIQQRELEKRIKEENKEKEKRERDRLAELSSSQPKHDQKLHITQDSTWTRDSTFDSLNYPTDYLSADKLTENREDPQHGISTPPQRNESNIPASIPSRSLKPQSSVPSINRSTKPPSLLCASTDLKGSQLRPIIVPSELIDRFLKLAFINTSRNIETCGILAGKLSHNKFIVTHLLLPQQVGTSDSCLTQHEEELFAHQDSLDLITLGWIHTHPSQTAFLSSVDLHTHCSYQLMMPEAVAIVCAPKFNETGLFCLTPDHGLPYISQCRKDGFHPHPKEPPLFSNADHVHLDNTISTEVVDLRT